MSPAIPVERLVDALRRADLLADTRGALPAQVAGVTDDSRHVSDGVLFLAVRGADRDGHAFVPGAEASGAALVAVEDATAGAGPALVVRDSRRAAAILAAAYFDTPASALTLIGVTGTNGKTTTVGMLRHLLDSPDARCASIGTLGVLIGSEGRPLDGGGGLTTPGPVELQRVLRALVDEGVGTVAIETSSHALHQRRVEGLAFRAGVFTNLTRDHLDYHRTMEEYLAAKALLIDLLTDDGVAVVNANDRAWEMLPAAPRLVRFGLGTGSDVRAEDVAYTDRGSAWTLVLGAERHSIRLPLIGDFNVSNALGAAATASALGAPGSQIAERLSEMPQVPGRLEIISESPPVLRDYAHTPDALERAIAAVRPFVTGTLWTVFGCGGDRDKGKRSEMGRIAERLSDQVVVTSDNPRTEDPGAILADIEAGMTRRAHTIIEDRQEAIRHAVLGAREGDVVLLAGKGHETYQIRGTERLPFDERIIVRDILSTERP